MKIINLQNTNFSLAKQQPRFQLLFFFFFGFFLFTWSNSWIGLFFLKKIIHLKPNPQNLETHGFQPAVTKCVRFCIFVLFIDRLLKSSVSFVFVDKSRPSWAENIVFPPRYFAIINQNAISFSPLYRNTYGKFCWVYFSRFFVCFFSSVSNSSSLRLTKYSAQTHFVKEPAFTQFFMEKD